MAPRQARGDKGKGVGPFRLNSRFVQYGFQCEECEQAIFPATTRSELAWLRDRIHVVREVAKHAQTGLDTWMLEGLEFLERHSGHSVVLVSRPSTSSGQAVG